MMSKCALTCDSVRVCSYTINLPLGVGTAAKVKLNHHVVDNNVQMPVELMYMIFVKKSYLLSNVVLVR